MNDAFFSFTRGKEAIHDVNRGVQMLLGRKERRSLGKYAITSYFKKPYHTLAAMLKRLVDTIYIVLWQG